MTIVPLALAPSSCSVVRMLKVDRLKPWRLFKPVELLSGRYRRVFNVLTFHGDLVVIVHRCLRKITLLNSTSAFEEYGVLRGSQHGHDILCVFSHVGDLNTLVDMAFCAVLGLDLGNVEVCERRVTVLEMQ